MCLTKRSEEKQRFHLQGVKILKEPKPYFNTAARRKIKMACFTSIAREPIRLEVQYMSLLYVGCWRVQWGGWCWIHDQLLCWASYKHPVGTGCQTREDFDLIWWNWRWKLRKELTVGWKSLSQQKVISSFMNAHLEFRFGQRDKQPLVFF